MMTIYQFNDITPGQILNRDIQAEENVSAAVDAVLADVRRRGDAALKEYTKRFDGVELEQLQVSQSELDEAWTSLDAEFINSGDPSRLQKWDVPINYTIQGEPTADDLKILNDFVLQLNYLEGFPGIWEAESPELANLRIHFCDEQTMHALMGDGFVGLDGAVTFWYDRDQIYDAIVCIRTDLDQHLRSSVILEELYNSLGPIQDTSLREDSIIYSGYSEPQALTPMDELLLKLLYHPTLRCGMTKEECDAAIRALYH